MNKIIFIKFIPKYETYTEDVGVAINREIAEKYTEDLKAQYPDAYNGYFLYEEFNLIKD